jgi:hypothetical protein
MTARLKRQLDRFPQPAVSMLPVEFEHVDHLTGARLFAVALHQPVHK